MYRNLEVPDDTKIYVIRFIKISQIRHTRCLHLCGTGPESGRIKQISLGVYRTVRHMELSTAYFYPQYSLLSV
jgi:hypothetical protein